MSTNLRTPSWYRQILNHEERAIAIAIDAHRDQVDKQGLPYIHHLLRVMLAVNEPERRQVAVLHDLIEDTSWSVLDLREAGLSDKVIAAVELLTRNESDSYCDYVIRIAANPLATAAKLADLNDNYRLDRVAFREDHFQEDRNRIGRYIISHDFLLGRIDIAEYQRRMQYLE